MSFIFKVSKIIVAAYTQVIVTINGTDANLVTMSGDNIILSE